MLVINNKEMITSLELVKQINIFRKEEGNKNDLEHKNLLAVIREEFDEEIDELKIQPIFYKDSMNREKPMFNLTLSQAKQVLVRESKVVRKAVIKYIDELEKQLMTQTPKLPTTYLEALEQLVEREKLLVEQAPKVDYYNKVLDSESSFTTTQIAKEIEMSAIQLNVLLSNLGVQFKQSGQWMLTAKYQDKGFTKTRTHTLPDGNTKHSTTWTEKGRQFILELSEGF